MKKDSSGISTIIVVVIVAVIVVAAAAAAYVLLVNDEKENIEGKEVAPGTSMSYEMSMEGMKVGVITIEYEGQNAEEYLVKSTAEMSIFGMTSSAYGWNMMPKETEFAMVNPDAELVKVETIKNFKTFEGKKTVDKYETTAEVTGYTGHAYIYVNTSKTIMYKMEMTVEGEGLSITMILEMTACKFVWQDEGSYVESEAIGTTQKYVSPTNSKWTAEIKCVADARDGKYGASYKFNDGTADEEEVLYFLADCPGGKITDSEEIETGVWEYTDAVTGITIRITHGESDITSKIILMPGPNQVVFNKVAS
jgi:hypothetical protein